MNSVVDRTSRFAELADSYLEHIRILVLFDDSAANLRDFLGPWWTFQRAAASPLNHFLVHTYRDAGVWLNNPCPVHARRQLLLQDWISDEAWRAIETQKRCKSEWAADSMETHKKARSFWTKDYKKNRLIIDHAVPIKVIRNKLFREKHKREFTRKENLKQFLESYVKHAVLTAEENECLDKKQLNSRMPNDWDGVDPYARYRSVNIQQKGGA